MKAIILAGGFGKRLRPLTDTVPKPMVPVADKPILRWQMEWLRRAGVDEFVLCIGHLKDRVIEYFKDGRDFGVRVSYVIEDEPLGTGGALRNALPHFPRADPFFTVNGDVLTSLDAATLIRKREDTGAMGVLALVPLPSPYGTVTTDQSGRVSAFLEKPRLMDHWINAGVYCLHPAVAEYLPKKGSLETEVFPKLAREGKLGAVQFSRDFWMSVDSPKDLEEATKALAGRPA